MGSQFAQIRGQSEAQSAVYTQYMSVWSDNEEVVHDSMSWFLAFATGPRPLRFGIGFNKLDNHARDILARCAFDALHAR